MLNYWEKSDWELDDKHLKALSISPFFRSPPFIPEKSGLYVIRGPRQIGKTTWLKLILKHHVEKNNSCYFQSCEDIEDHQALTALLKSTEDRKVVILDEISFISDWYRSIKKTLDSGDQRILVVTGSNSVDLLKGADRMPGRFGFGGEFLLLPMDFGEFQNMRKQAGWPILSPVDELELYFKVGGFPFALLESGSAGLFPQKAIRTYQNWLEGDLLKLNKQVVYLKELMVALAQAIQNPVSLQTLAKKTQMGSHHTVQDYVQILENCFAVRILYAMDPNSGSYRFRTNKKFYFTDPLIYWAAVAWSGEKIKKTRSSELAEMVAHESLHTKFERIGFVQSQNSGEIDFFSKQNNWAIEVKWTDAVTELSKAFKTTAAAQKIVWSKNNFLKDWPRSET